MVTKNLNQQRNSEATRRRILASALSLIAEHGFARFGVNALAAEAGIDKVLIYRYFGNADGVIAALAERVDLWLGDIAIAKIEEGVYPAVIAAFLKSYADSLLSNPLVRRVLAWELVESSERVRLLADARARAIRLWFAEARKSAGPPPEGIDAAAVNAILIAAIHHLVLSRDAIGRFAGIDLAEPAHWGRIEAAVAALIEATYGAADFQKGR